MNAKASISLQENALEVDCFELKQAQHEQYVIELKSQLKKVNVLGCSRYLCSSYWSYVNMFLVNNQY